MIDYTDLIERLRDKAFKRCGPTMEAVHTKTDEWKAADALEAQAKQIKHLRYLEEEWSESKHNKALLGALDAGYDKGYRNAMDEIISIARAIKEEYKGDD